MVIVRDGAAKGKGQQVGERRVLARGPVPESHCACLIGAGEGLGQRETKEKRLGDLCWMKQGKKDHTPKDSGERNLG